MSESAWCVIFVLVCRGKDEGGGGGSGGCGAVVAVCRCLYCYFYSCCACPPLVVESVRTSYSACL